MPNTQFGTISPITIERIKESSSPAAAACFKPIDEAVEELKQPEAVPS